MLGADGPEEMRCSRAGCRETAVFAVHWRNPRIHGADRVKTWLACHDHREFLHDYLASRSFPVLVTEAGQTVERLPEPPA